MIYISSSLLTTLFLLLLCVPVCQVLRNARWDKAFSETPQEEIPRDTVNRKATIVIEHLIQASDVAHTMQHWHIYRVRF